MNSLFCVIIVFFLVFACKEGTSMTGTDHADSDGGTQIPEGIKSAGTKTLYKFILDSNENVKSYASKIPSFCKPIHFSFVARHGTRFPGKSNIKMIKEFKNDTHEYLNDEELKNWKPSFDVVDAKLLMEMGRNEMYGIGLRLSLRFRSLFVDDLNDKENNKIKFISSSMSRCKESAEHFIKGMKSAVKFEKKIKFTIEENDSLMRYFDLCDKYLSSVKENKTALQEYHNYLNGDDLKNIGVKLIDKLGVSQSHIDKHGAGKLAWTFLVMCVSEIAAGLNSPWCKYLDDDDYDALDYRSDMKHYWVRSHGYNITGLQSCPLLQDIFHNLDLSVVGSTTSTTFPKAILRFGHAETLLPLYALLGIFKDDEPLLHTNRLKMKNRKFRTSRICPYSANIAFVMYQCETKHTLDEEDILRHQWPNKFEKYMIQFLLNEKVVRLPMCETDLCPYQTVKNQYASELINCDFEKICELPQEEKEDVHDEL